MVWRRAIICAIKKDGRAGRWRHSDGNLTSNSSIKIMSTQKRQYCHLHLHTDYSLLDGAIQHEPLAKRAAELGMPAAAVTDHGNLFGAISFYNTMKSAGVK